MTNELTVIENHGLAAFNFDNLDLGTVGGAYTERPRLPYVNMVKNPDGIFGFEINLNDGLLPSTFTDTLRVLFVDVHKPRLMYPYKADGSSGYDPNNPEAQKPICRSADGVQPLSKYVGTVHYHPFKSNPDGSSVAVKIGDVDCANCPMASLREKVPVIDVKTRRQLIDPETGKPVWEMNPNTGKPKTHPPMCREEHAYLVYLPDYGILATLKMRNHTQRKALLEYSPKIPKFPEMFHAKSKTTGSRIMLFAMDYEQEVMAGKVPTTRAAVMTVEQRASGGGSKTLVPIYRWDDAPLQESHAQGYWNAFHAFHGLDMAFNRTVEGLTPLKEYFKGQMVFQDDLDGEEFEEAEEAAPTVQMSVEQAKAKIAKGGGKGRKIESIDD